jgi:hypothetical protein
MIPEKLYAFRGRSLNVCKSQINAQPSQIEAHISDALDEATAYPAVSRWKPT